MSIYHKFTEIFTITSYPSGEKHLALIEGVDLQETMNIEVHLRNFEDLGQALTANQILRHNQVKATWFAPYLPFARDDRRRNMRDGFELQIALELVRSLDLVIADPHSDISAQIKHIPQKSAVELFKLAGAFDNDPLVVIPDHGASKKAHSWLGNLDFIQATKVRSQANGKLSDTVIYSDQLNGRGCIIVDDICDGGATFLALAKALKEKGAGKLSLAVTHGLFTKGLARLSEEFSKIYSFAETFNSGDVHTTISFEELFRNGEMI